MFPNAFEYVAPATLDEAIADLSAGGDDAKVLAGGQSLLPMMKLRLAAPALLVDIGRVRELARVREEDGGLVIGALATHAGLEHDRALRERYPLLARAARHIADPLVRNRGTMAGSLAHADPAADWGAVLLALGGAVVATGPSGERRIAADDLFRDLFTTSLDPSEIITAVHVPPPRGRAEGEHMKLERKVGDFAVVAVALAVDLADNGTVLGAGIGMAAVGPTALRAREAERVLTGQTLGPGTIREAAELAARCADPTSDHRGSASYKRDVVRLFVERGLAAIMRRTDPAPEQSA
jgi:carbon-monoxide dehydrogenase medium subunit